MTRRGTKRKDAPSEPIIVNEDLTKIAMPSIDALYPTSAAAAAIAANAPQAGQPASNTTTGLVNNPMQNYHPSAQRPTNSNELQHYHYLAFHDWLNRWHIYQHSLTNYWREYNQDPFNRRYLELMSYKEKHGNVDVPSTYVEEEPLGKWVERMKVEAREGRLDAAKKEQLRSLGLNFDVEEGDGGV